MINEAEVNILDTKIERLHRTGPKKDKKQVKIVKFTLFSRCTVSYSAKKTLKL